MNDLSATLFLPSACCSSGRRRIPASAAEPTRDYQVRDHPLPDFIPQQLFGDLNLPQVEIVIDPQQRGHQPESLFLPIVQALRTLAPGQVTRRFGYRHAFAHHWVAPPSLQTPLQTLAVEVFCEEFEETGTFKIREGGSVRPLRCVRPWKIHPHQPPGNVAITSNAQFEWRSQLAPAREDDRLRFEPPSGSARDSVLDEICFYTHNDRNHVEVRRFALASHASISFRNGNQADLSVRFVQQGTNEPAAVGFAQQSDGIVFRFRVPADLGLSPAHPNRRKVRAFRAAYFRHRAQGDPTLDAVASSFQRDWLTQIYLSALMGRAVAVMSAMHSRILRPGSSPATDLLLRRLVEDWMATRSGCRGSRSIFNAATAFMPWRKATRSARRGSRSIFNAATANSLWRKKEF